LPALAGVVWFVLGMGVIARFKHSWSLVRALEWQYNQYLYRVVEKRGERLAYRSARLVDLGQAGAPPLFILTTNLTTGELCSFNQNGFHTYTAAAQGYQGRPFVQNQFPIGKAVAASSAFPVVFSPVRLGDADYG